MAAIHETTIILRFFGDELDPDEISACLGHPPSVGMRKGESWITKRGTEAVARTGTWRLKVDDRKPSDLDAQIAELLGPLSDDLSVWQDLTSRFHGNIFCGFFMQESNEGISLSAKSMKDLDSRGLEIGFDIYDPGAPNR